jgi:hypothetical protein
MAILVDEARWPWRGTYYCHLVSDSDLGELHNFAGQLGQRRVGFQGDHYDIDVLDRALALEMGAVECTSREVVRALKSAGLRLRPSQFEKWQLLGRADGPLEFEGLSGWGLETRLLDRALAELDGAHAAVTGVFALSRPGLQAVVFAGAGLDHKRTERPSQGVYWRADRQHRWALELMSRPLAVTE